MYTFNFSVSTWCEIERFNEIIESRKSSNRLENIFRETDRKHWGFGKVCISFIAYETSVICYISFPISFQFEQLSERNGNGSASNSLPSPIHHNNNNNDKTTKEFNICQSKDNFLPFLVCVLQSHNKILNAMRLRMRTRTISARLFSIGYPNNTCAFTV